MDKRQKQVFNVLFIAVFAAMLGLGIVGPLMPIFGKELGAKGIWLGVIFASYSFSRAIFMPIIGKISDKKGRKNFIVLGLFAYAVVSLLYLLAYNVFTLTLIRFVHGIASAMVIPIAMAYIGETTQEGKEGSRMGLFNTSFFLGMGAGPMIGGLLHDHYGMHSVFIAMAVLTGFSFLLTLFILPDIHPSESRSKKNKTKNLSLGKLLGNKLLVGLLIYRFINAMGRGGVMSFLPIYAADIDITPSQIGIILTINIFFMALLQIYFGKLADKYNKFLLVLIGASIGALSLLLIPMAKSFWALTLLALMMGLGGAISMPAATAINVKIGQKYGMGASMGIFNTAMSVGMILAPLISGAVMDLWGVHYIFYVSGAISVVGIMLFFYFIRRGMKEEGGVI